MLALRAGASVDWGDGDPLGRVLADLQLTGTFFCATDLDAPWSLEVPARDFASFHAVSSGECWLHARNAAPLRIGAGDLVFLAGSPSHRLVLAGRGRRAQLVCGGLSLRGHVATTLAALLPTVVVLRRDQALPIVAAALDAMRDESRSARPGSATLMNRLADVVIIHAIRGWLERADEPRSGWLAALRDPRIGPTIAGVHEAPGRAWTLDGLARAARMSRTTFAQRFTELIGTPPKHYVTAVRMHRARELLEREPVTVAELAARLGYDSESSFARAFKRHIGHAPGAVRRAALAAAVSAAPRATVVRRRWRRRRRG